LRADFHNEMPFQIKDQMIAIASSQA